MRPWWLIALVAACHPAAPVTPTAPPPLSRAAYAHYLDGKLAMYQRDWAAASVALEEARKAAPDEPMIVVELARAQFKANGKDPSAARATLAAARARWPAHGEVWIASADLEKSAPMYRRAIELLPDDERGYLGLAKVEPANAERTLRTLVKTVPTSVDGHYRLGVLLARRDELTAAIVELRAVIERDPDQIDARLDLARALRRIGQLDEAVLQTRSAFDRAAQPVEVAEELFWVLVEADDPTGALDLLTLLDDDRSDVDTLALIARLQRGLGRLDDARAVTEQIARRDGEAGTIALAELEFASGDAAAALAHLASIPDDAEHAVLARRITAEIQLATDHPAQVLATIAPLRAAQPKDLGLATLGALAGDPKALAGFGDTADTRYVRARIAERAGDHATVVTLLADADLDASAAQNLRGYALVELGRLPEARVNLLRARALSPGEPGVLDSWGMLLLREHSVDAAVRALEKAHRYAPLEPEILAHLAEAWAGYRAPIHAAKLLTVAETLHPNQAARREIERVKRAISAGG